MCFFLGRALIRNLMKKLCIFGSANRNRTHRALLRPYFLFVVIVELIGLFKFLDPDWLLEL